MFIYLTSPIILQSINLEKILKQFLWTEMLVHTFFNNYFLPGSAQGWRQKVGEVQRGEPRAFIWPHGTMWSLQRPGLHPPPSSLPYAEELALCGGLGSWLSAHTCTRCTPPPSSSPPPLPPKMENNRFFCFEVLLKIVLHSGQQVPRKEILGFQSNILERGNSSELTMKWTEWGFSPI